MSVLFGSSALYAVSCASGPLWQDSGLIQYRIWHNDIEGFLGLAISHPLFYIIGIAAKYIPLGEFGHRVNLISALAAAVAVANLFLLVRLWLGKDFPALVAAVSFAVCHTFWWHASVIETYTTWAAFFTAELLMLLQYVRTGRKRYLYLLGLFNGLAISVHMLASISLVCYAVFLLLLLTRKKISIRDLALFILLWVLGALPYEYLIIKNILQSGDIAGTLASAAFGARWRGAVLNATLTTRIVKENFLLIMLNFPTPTLLLFFIGFFGLFKVGTTAGFRNVLPVLTILFLGFAFRYTIADRYSFFIPFYCLASVFIGAGAYLLQTRWNSRVMVSVVLLFTFLPICVYAAAPRLAKKWQLNIGTRSDIPYRDDYEYFLKPWKTCDHGAERFAGEALEIAGDDAVIWADTTTVAPLMYMQEVKSKRPDVKIVSVVSSVDAPEFNEQTVGQILKERPVYVVSRKPGYCPEFILKNYDLIQAGVLWRVVGR